MRLQVVDGCVVLPNGVYDPSSSSWRAVVVAPAPYVFFRPVWSKDWTEEWAPGTTYQSVLPGDLIVWSAAGAENGSVFSVNIDMGIDMKPYLKAAEVFESLPQPSVATITAWLRGAGSFNNQLPPGIGWDGRFTAITQRRAERIRHTFGGAPDLLVTLLVEKSVNSSTFRVPEWADARALPSALETGALWVIWRWFNAVEVVDLVDAQEARQLPYDAVRVARVLLDVNSVSWSLYNNSLEG